MNDSIKNLFETFFALPRHIYRIEIYSEDEDVPLFKYVHFPGDKSVTLAWGGVLLCLTDKELQQGWTGWFAEVPGTPAIQVAEILRESDDSKRKVRFDCARHEIPEGWENEDSYRKKLSTLVDQKLGMESDQ